MADDLDIEAMLEESYRREGQNGNSGRDRDRERDKRKRSPAREEKSGSRQQDRDHRHSDRHGRDRDGRRDRERDHEGRRKKRSRSRDDRPPKESHHHHSRSKEQDRPPRVKPPPRSLSPIRPASPELSPEERDARTVFCMQLAARIRPRDLEEFFSAIGKVRDVRLILDNKSHRSKGIAYIEFREVESVPLAIGLNGQRLLGVPIIVQPSHAERNRMASAQAAAMKSMTGPMRLYVGSLHYNITEEMLRGIFEPFGKIDDMKLMKDHQTNRSAGYGFITYKNAEDAKKAMDQLNGFELAGRPMKIGNITEKSAAEYGGSYFDPDDMDRAGFGLGATGRIALMAKLAEGTGMQIPPAAASVLSTSPAVNPQNLTGVPPIATQCFMLSNMFDPTCETNTNWENEVKDDVIEECNKHGGVLHIFVDRTSPQGNVYVKCPSIMAAVASVNALHGRYFGGKVITAAYVPLPNYHSLFPDSLRAIQYVLPSTQRATAGMSSFYPTL